MNTAGKLIIGGLVLGGIAWAATAAAKSSGSSSKKKPTGNDVDPSFDPFHKGPDEPTGPGGGGGGGGGSNPAGPALGPGGFRTYGGPNGGLVFGHMSDAGIAKVDWNPNGNTVRFSHDCTVVLVGRQVWKMNDEIAGMWHAECVEYSNVKTCWLHGQNLCCRIDSMMTAGMTSAKAIGQKLIAEMEPPCIDADYSAWPQAMKDFVEWMRTHVNEYVLASSGQADW